MDWFPQFMGLLFWQVEKVVLSSLSEQGFPAKCGFFESFWSEFMKESVIVVGPQGCGKTENAEALRERFRLGNILDGWMPDQPVPEDTLVLTNVDQSEIPDGLAKVVQFEEVSLTV